MAAKGVGYEQETLPIPCFPETASSHDNFRRDLACHAAVVLMRNLEDAPRSRGEALVHGVARQVWSRRTDDAMKS